MCIAYIIFIISIQSRDIIHFCKEIIPVYLYAKLSMDNLDYMPQTIIIYKQS